MKQKNAKWHILITLTGCHVTQLATVFCVMTNRLFLLPVWRDKPMWQKRGGDVFFHFCKCLLIPCAQRFQLEYCYPTMGKGDSEKHEHRGEKQFISTPSQTTSEQIHFPPIKIKFVTLYFSQSDRGSEKVFRNTASECCFNLVPCVPLSKDHRFYFI